MQSCIFALEVACLTYLSLALEKNVSWKVYIAVVLLFFSGSRVIVEIGQKNIPVYLKEEFDYWSYWLKMHEATWYSEEQYHLYTILSKYLNLPLVLCLSLSGLSPLVLAEKCDAICVRPESSEMDVFTRQLIAMSDAASLYVCVCVGGECWLDAVTTI